ncbi:MAG: aldo/keto reductase [Clostridia bacterium]|nr:aldo/keto reductase [Clostridia bacterium]
MKYRQFPKISEKVSIFGLGCMRFNGVASGDSVINEKKAIKLIRQAIDGGVNYLDTAYVYLDKTSETVVGKALRDGYREKVTIATKMPIEHVNNYEEMEALLDSELKKLQTDHIDYYLMHGIDKAKWLKFKEMGADKFFEDKKREGKIRYKCFSFHGPYEDFEYIIKDYDWDMVQIQYNFMDIDNQAGTKGLKLAGELGIPVVIMEGLLGGKLASAPDNVQKLYDEFETKRSPVEWAFRWLGNCPEIMTILSGCNEEEQISDNLRIFDTIEAGVMDDKELALIDAVRKAYNDRTKIGCTGCRYCMPCPGGVDIPRVFTVWNECSLYGGKAQDNWNYMELNRLEMTPDKCLECGACETACPQSLNIIESLKTAWSEFN